MVAMNVWPTDAADGSVSSEARWRKMGRLWAPTAVDPAAGAGMAPTLAFPNLTVKAGACWVDGHFCELPGDQVLAVTANGLVVVRFDPAANTAELLYRDGVTVPNQSPTGVYEMPLARMAASALTDLRAFNNQARFGGSWARTANQSIPTGSATQIQFDTETADLGGFAPPMPNLNFTVPANGDGLYSINFVYTFGAALTGGAGWINVGSRLVTRVPAEATYGTGAVTLANVPLKAGDIINAIVQHAQGSARSVNAILDIYRTPGI